MKICLVSYEFPPTIFGGAGTYAGLLFEGLTKQGIDVTVLTHGAKSSKKIRRINTPDTQYWRRLFFSHSVNKILNKSTVKDEYDIIHFNEPHIVLGKYIKPLVSSIHSTGINELLIKIKLSKLCSTKDFVEALIKSPVGAMGDLFSCAKSNKIICPTEHLKEMISKYCFYDPNNIKVISNGITLNDYVDKLLEKAILNQYNIKKKKYILFVGRLDPIKGVEYLIKAYKELKKDHPETKLLIVGSGFYDEFLKKINCDDIVFTGHISDKKILSVLYRNSLMMVIPSLYEAHPLVLLEAMTHSLPVVASDVGGIPSVMKDGVNGFLVPPGNSDLLYQKMKILTENGAMRRKMGKTNRKNVRDNYTLDSMVKKTIDIYDSALAQFEKRDTHEDLIHQGYSSPSVHA